MSIKESTFLASIRESFKKNIRQYTMIIALLAIWIIFTAMTEGLFLTPRNLSNLFLQTVTVAIVAAGMTLIIVTGNIDLSVGSVAAFIGAVAAVMQVKFNIGTIPTILIALAVGVLIGAWHGFWVAFQKVPAFIVTLASMLIFRGAILGVTGGQTIGPMHDSFKALGQYYLPVINQTLPFRDTSLVFALLCIALFIVFDMRKRSQRIKYGFSVLSIRMQIMKIALISVVIAGIGSIMFLYEGVPYSVFILIAIALILTFVANNTVFGRHLYAIGGSADAARLSGINISGRIMGLFILFGALVAVSGVVMTARLNAATTSAGVNMELDAIAAAVIGGTSLMGGSGTIIGAIVGAFIMASLDNGMSLLNLDTMFQYIVKGIILLLAVWVDIATRKKS